MFKTYLGLGFLCVVVAATTTFGITWDKHPQLNKGREAVSEAVHELEQANDNNNTGEFDGHRAKAVEHLKLAQEEIEKAAQVADSGK
jgi:hypothetical protein